MGKSAAASFQESLESVLLHNALYISTAAFSHFVLITRLHSGKTPQSANQVARKRERADCREEQIFSFAVVPVAYTHSASRDSGCTCGGAALWRNMKLANRLHTSHHHKYHLLLCALSISLFFHPSRSHSNGRYRAVKSEGGKGAAGVRWWKNLLSGKKVAAAAGAFLLLAAAEREEKYLSHLHNYAACRKNIFMRSRVILEYCPL
jgi:hypothetical protein